MIEYLSLNKEWIFSGIGILVLIALAGGIRYLWPKFHKDKSDGDNIADHDNITNIFIGADNKARDLRNRAAMLNIVRDTWIKGVLEKSLYTEILIDLDMEKQFDIVERPYDISKRVIGQADQPLPSGTKMIDVFDDMGHSLLILGEPGSGKTTMLLELARDLIKRAESDEDHQIPVVFNLSSWSSDNPSIAEWLTSELKTKYNIPEKVGRIWVQNDDLLPLLDGLDEVALERREQCVQAINGFQQDHITPLIVCSRTNDYEMLSNQLKLQGGILLQPLTPEQIKTYLSGVSLPDPQQVRQLEAVLKDGFTDEGLCQFCYDHPNFRPVYDQLSENKDQQQAIQLLARYSLRRNLMAELILQTDVELLGSDDGQIEAVKDELDAVRQMLDYDEQLQKLARLPLFLAVMVLAYRGKSSQDLGALNSLEDRRQHLFNAYISAMFARRSDNLAYTQQQSIPWLVWLASMMVQHRQTVFRLEDLQPDWLSRSTKQFRLIVGVVIGVVVGVAVGVVVGLIDGLSEGQFFGLVFGLNGGLGLIFGLFLGLGVGLFVGLFLGINVGLSDIKIEPIETMEWSWKEARDGLFLGLVFGLVLGLFLGLGVGLLLGLRVGLLLGLLFGVLFGLSRGLSGKNVIEQKNAPNQGIHQSVRNAIRAFLIFGLVFGLIFGLILGLIDGMGEGQFGGLIDGLIDRQFFGLLDAQFEGLFFRLSAALLFGLGGGLFPGLLFFGGEAAIKHYVLRYLLYRKGYSPSIKEYIPFLDFCADLILLRKVGGSYIFIHRMLLEHFAAKAAGQAYNQMEKG